LIGARLSKGFTAVLFLTIKFALLRDVESGTELAICHADETGMASIMMKYLVCGAAFLAMSASCVWASPVTIDGYYSTTVVSTSGQSPSISDEFGNQAFFNNFLVPNVGTAATTPTDFFTLSAPCYQIYNYNYCPTEKGTVDVSFSFVLPSGATGAVTDSASYSFSNGSGSLTWTNLTIPVDFNDGDSVDIYLTNASDPNYGQVNLTPTISFGQADPPDPVPEPITLSVFGVGIAGAAAMRRRRNKAKG
jgi:hypothetical protein